MRRNWAPFIAFLLAGIILGSALVEVSLSIRSPPGECVPGPIVAIVNDTETPAVLLNSPWDASRADSSTANLRLGNGTVETFFAWNGSVWGAYNVTNWTVRIGIETRSNGPSCSSTFFLSREQPGGGVALTPGFYMNDSQEPGYIRVGNPLTIPVYYWNGYYHQTFQVSTCGSGPVFRNLTSDRITVGVPFTYHGVNETVNVTLPALNSYGYVFPADGGTWAVDNLSAPGGPGGGWAFSYLGPCN